MNTPHSTGCGNPELYQRLGGITRQLHDALQELGHAEKLQGTMGQLPEGEVLLVETVADVALLAPRDPAKLAYITQTTLSVDDTAGIVAALESRFPAIVGPHKEDICYATTNRQAAVKAIAGRVDALLEGIEVESVGPGDDDLAVVSYRIALDRCANDVERAHLERRLTELGHGRDP